MILGTVLGKTPNAYGWVRVNCPVCDTRKGSPDHRASLGYRPKTGGFKCFRCGVRGRLSGKGYVLPTSPEAEADKPKVELGDFAEYHPLWTKDAQRSEALQEPMGFLRRRGITRRHQAAAQMHAAVTGRYGGRVLVPHLDEHGEWWGFTARAYRQISEREPKVLYPAGMDRTRMYNEHVLFDSSTTPVMLVEGCLDAAWYLPLCVAALGKPTSAHLDTLSRAARPVVVCLDGDAWEEGRALAYKLRLRGVPAGFVRLPAGEDPNSVDPNWLRDQVAQAHTGEPCTTSSRSTPSPTSSTELAAAATTRSAG